MPLKYAFKSFCSLVEMLISPSMFSVVLLIVIFISFTPLTSLFSSFFLLLTCANIFFKVYCSSQTFNTIPFFLYLLLHIIFQVCYIYLFNLILLAILYIFLTAFCRYFYICIYVIYV